MFNLHFLIKQPSSLSLFLPSQANLSDLGRLLMQGSFSVWTEHKKGHAKVKDLARFKPMQRHLFLHEKALLFCKRREENGEGYEKAPSYSFKQSLNVRRSETRAASACKHATISSCLCGHKHLLSFHVFLVWK